MNVVVCVILLNGIIEIVSKNIVEIFYCFTVYFQHYLSIRGTRKGGWLNGWIDGWLDGGVNGEWMNCEQGFIGTSGGLFRSDHNLVFQITSEDWGYFLNYIWFIGTTFIFIVCGLIHILKIIQIGFFLFSFFIYCDKLDWNWNWINLNEIVKKMDGIANLDRFLMICRILNKCTQPYSLQIKVLSYLFYLQYVVINYRQ